MWQLEELLSIVWTKAFGQVGRQHWGLLYSDDTEGKN